MYTFDDADILNPPNGPMGGYGTLAGLGLAPLNIPTNLSSQSLIDKVFFYIDATEQGYSDQEIRKEVEKKLGVQSNDDWAILGKLAEYAVQSRNNWDISPYLSRLTDAQRLYAKSVTERNLETNVNALDAASQANDFVILVQLSFKDGIVRDLYAMDGFQHMKNLSQHYGVPIDNYGQFPTNPIPRDELVAKERVAMANAISANASALIQQRDELRAQIAAEQAAEAAALNAPYEAAKALEAELAAEMAAKTAEAERILAPMRAAAAAAADAAARAAADAAAKAAAADAAAKAAAQKIPIPAGGDGRVTRLPGPDVSELIPMTIDEKVAYYLQLRNKGMTDAEVRAFVEASMGPQTDTDWKMLRDLALPVVATETPVTPPPPTGAANVAPLLLAVAAAYLLGA